MSSYKGITELTQNSDFVRIRGVNSTDASYPNPARLPTETEPTGKGIAAGQQANPAVLDLRDGASGEAGNTRYRIAPYGSGSDTNTFKMTVIGWAKARNRSGDVATDPRPLWLPVTIAEFTVTLSTPVGVDGTVCVSTDRFADTISRTVGSDSSSEVVSPADNTIAHCIVDMKGFAKMEIIFDRNSSATSCNALVAPY